MLWLLLLSGAGVRALSARAAPGVLSRTFQGWSAFPPGQHAYMAQYSGTEFQEGRAYVSYTYAFLFANFALLAPLRFLWDIPYERAHNVLPYVYALCLLALLWWTSRKEWSEAQTPLRLLLLATAIGLVLTSPLQWLSLLQYNRDNVHVLVAAAFCYLSTFVFYDRPPGAALVSIGVFLALWSPWYLPAWILAALFLQRDLTLNRPWFVKAIAVCALGAVNVVLPRVICQWLGMTAAGSTLWYRSGLDGSTQYFTSIHGAVLWPVDPRHWPSGFYVAVACAAGMGVHFLLRKSGTVRPLAQIAFLAIPYATMAILLPQFTSIHPYFTDLLLIVPATFVLAFWSLQRRFFDSLTSRSCVLYFLVAAMVLMTNLLTIAQAAN